MSVGIIIDRTALGVSHHRVTFQPDAHSVINEVEETEFNSRTNSVTSSREQKSDEINIPAFVDVHRSASGGPQLNEAFADKKS